MAKSELLREESLHECGDPRRYNAHFDSHFCVKCDAWLESQCSDALCGFCSDRPEKPSQTDK